MWLINLEDTQTRQYITWREGKRVPLAFLARRCYFVLHRCFSSANSTVRVVGGVPSQFLGNGAAVLRQLLRYPVDTSLTLQEAVHHELAA